MTVSQIRDYMMEHVVPEKVMPQNIVEFLMDENAELPELDAFTFLNRLRGLGIGSADFLYLLKGCGAPKGAVEKIEANPAMNLQSLILTLDSSGLTAQDYTRMLYTARQIWERTLTMRLESPVQREESAAEYPEEAPDYDEAVEEAPNEEATESAEDEPIAPYAAEDTVGADYIDDMAMEEAAEEELDYGEADAAYSDITQSIPDITQSLPPQGLEETSELRPVDMERLMESLAEDIAKSGEDEPLEEDAALDNTPDEAEPSDVSHAAYHGGALIASAVGAAVLCGLSAAASVFGLGTAEAEQLVCAESSREIFVRIYESYTNGIVAADVTGYSLDDTQLFGDILVKADDELGVFSDGGSYYFADADAITAAEYSDGRISEAAEITPPDGAYFVKVWEQDGELFAAFTQGEPDGCCGFMKLAGGEAVFISEQDGVLTDIIIEDGMVKLGSVYTPSYDKDFTDTQTEFYLPSAGGELIASENILLGGEGCSYAVSGAYTSDGALVSGFGILGCPLYSSAEGYAALYDDGQAVLVTPDGTVSAAIGGVSAAAYSQGLFAVAVSDESAENADSVRLYDASFTLVTEFTSFVQEVTALRFDGSVLYFGGVDGVFMAADCSDPQDVTVCASTANGRIIGENALCWEKTGTGLRLSAYEIVGGSAEELYSYVKTLSDDELETLVLCGGNTVCADGGRFGMAYSYFDGVSVVSEYAVFGTENGTKTLFDDKTGFTAAFAENGRIYAVYSGGVCEAG